jgi:hypothetical protein
MWRTQIGGVGTATPGSSTGMKENVTGFIDSSGYPLEGPYFDF